MYGRVLLVAVMVFGLGTVLLSLLCSPTTTTTVFPIHRLRRTRANEEEGEWVGRSKWRIGLPSA